MKKIFLLLGIVGILTLPSCKKNWNCSCTSGSGAVTNHEIQDQTLLNAKAQCNSMSYSNAIASQNCSLQ
jgi:hypothetical protein